MRRIIQALLEGVVVDGAPIPPDRVIQGSAMKVQPEFPFIVHKYSITTPTPSGRGRPGLEVWVYDEPGSYISHIDPILSQVRTIFNQYPFTLADGSEYLAVVDWTNDSADLPAEEFHGITRMSAFNLVGRSA
jgi:hypothetical protein